MNGMVIAQFTIELRLVAHSLKEKRMVVKSVLARMGQRHNLSVYESDYHDVHNRAAIAAAWVGPDPDTAHRLLDKIITIAELAGAEVVDNSIEIL